MQWKEFITGIIAGVIATFIATFIVFVIKKAIESAKMKHSEYTGQWDQLIYKNEDVLYEGEVIKRDRYNISHIKLLYSGKLIINIKGTIQRKFPLEQNHRRWDCIGYLDGDVLTILYQSDEAQKSRGCIYLRLENDFEFRGYYLEEHRDGMIDKTPVILKKVKSED